MRMAPLPYLLGIAAAALVSVCVWKLLGAPVDIVDAPGGKINCISYTPFRANQSPLEHGTRIDPANIDADFAQLSKISNCVRLYSVDLGLGAAVPLAAKYHMRVLLGIWIGYDDAYNQRQIAKALTIAKAHPKTIRAIIVGNEVLLRGEQTPDDLVRYINEVKKGTDLPVTYADVTHFWLTAPPELARAVDFITIHVLPYWEDQPTSAKRGVAYLDEVLHEVSENFPGKRIFIGETGFPSAGRQREAAVPSIVSQARYLRAFAAYAHDHDLDYNLIEAYDQPWKRAQEGTVGGYWGIFTANRQAKFPWTGPVSSHPHWHREMAIAIGFSILILTIMGFRGGNPEPLGGIGAGVGAGFAGSALLLQIEHSMMAWRTPFEGAVELAILLQTLAVLFFVLPEITRKKAGIAPLSIGETLNWLRRPATTALCMSLYLGLIQLATTCGALVISLGLCFDGRYRDFPLAAFIVPAVSFALLSVNRGDQKRAYPNRHEEIMFSLLFIASAAIIAFNEGPKNTEALIWCGTNLIFVLPWAGQIKAAIKSLITKPEAVAST